MALLTRNSSRLKDILTPANAITMVGLLLTLIGVFHLNTLHGVVIAIVGRVLDVVDGPVARRTHTSHFGALLDAGSDKASMLALLVAMYYFQLAPVLFLSFVLVYHISVLYMSLSGERHGIAAKPTQLGKYTMFLHLGALLCFALSDVISKYAVATYDVAGVVALVGVIVGVVSLYTYVEIYIRTMRSLHK